MTADFRIEQIPEKDTQNRDRLQNHIKFGRLRISLEIVGMGVLFSPYASS